MTLEFAAKYYRVISMTRAPSMFFFLPNETIFVLFVRGFIRNFPVDLRKIVNNFRGTTLVRERNGFDWIPNWIFYDDFFLYFTLHNIGIPEIRSIWLDYSVYTMKRNIIVEIYKLLEMWELQTTKTFVTYPRFIYTK